MYTCDICSYTTNRKWSFNYHISRKNTCSRRVKADSHNPDGANVSLDGANVSLGGANVSLGGANVCSKCSKRYKRKIDCDKHMKKCRGVDNLQCPTCLKVFETRNGKYKHVKLSKCSAPLESTDDQINKLKEEIELLKSNKPLIINNITNTNNNIHINNYDTPNIDHVTSSEIRRLYYKSKQEVHMMIFEAIRLINSIPENRSIRFLEGSKSKFAEVKKDNETLILPMNEVLETLLTKSSEVCGDGLRECVAEGMIKGTRCETVLTELDTLATDDRIADKDNRLFYLTYVKSSML